MIKKTIVNFQRAYKKNLDKNKGFTLIEVLVVTSLTVLVLFSTVILLLTFLLNQARLTQKQKVKIAGDNALKQIEQAVRGARSVQFCNSGMSSLTFYDLAENTGTIELDSGVIASRAADATVYYLTPNDLTADNLNFNCYSGPDSEFITVSFSLDTGGGEGLMDEAVGQDFRTSINLRN